MVARRRLTDSHAARPTIALCPADPEHGPLLDVDGRTYCPHQDHDGRPKTHPAGQAPQSSAYPARILPNRTDVPASEAPGPSQAELVAPSATPEPDRPATAAPGPYSAQARLGL